MEGMITPNEMPKLSLYKPKVGKVEAVRVLRVDKEKGSIAFFDNKNVRIYRPFKEESAAAGGGRLQRKVCTVDTCQ